jgi:hypothetical protein
MNRIGKQFTKIKYKYGKYGQQPICSDLQDEE